MPGLLDFLCVYVSVFCSFVFAPVQRRYAGLVDVLSDAITAMRTGRPHAARVRRRMPFGRRFSAVDGAGFHVVLRGTCWLFPPDGEPVALAPGEVVFLPRGCAHGLADGPRTPLAGAPTAPTEPEPADGEQPGDTLMICGGYLLDRTRAHPLLDELPEVVHLPARAGRHPELRAALDLLDAELARVRPGADGMVPALLDVLLLHMLRAWFEERAADGAAGWAAALHDPAVAAALAAIHGEPDRPWTVAELGARAGLSRAAFARRFTALVGRPPLDYLTWWRLTLAARLLRESETPLGGVARQVGYTSEFAFAHAFKRRYGQPPGRFRRSVR
ncbi:AraC family transcriptional regulator [Amycolatopsis taiwanensis]|uniref:AraC family transcriptional regulator n=1 Tax=Amycolatopsis taiwanensis TaxID=342230 RepID=A0A9W6R496_9PSEU|nr:AraC family transcriptional regulator [Amycolatopsis taiwanensis]